MSTASAPFGPPPPQDTQEPTGTAPVAPALQAVDDARSRFQQAQAAQAQAQEGQILANFRTTVDTDPGVAAQALQVARDLGLDPNLLTDDDVRRVALGVHERRDVARRQLLERSPVLARRLRDVQFTSIARDDLDNLQTTETQFSDLGKAYRRGKLQVEIGMLGASLAARRAFSGGDAVRTLDDLPPDALQHYRALKSRLDRLGESTGFFDNATEVVGQMVQTLPVAIAAGVAAATPAAVAGPAAAGPAFVVGSLTSSFAQTAAIEGGSFYLDMREKGYTHDEALAPALTVAAVNGALEVAGEVATALPFARALRREIARVGLAKVEKSALTAGAKGAATDVLAKKTARTVAGQAAREYGTSVLVETSTEVLQEVASVIGEEMTRRNAPEEIRALIRGQTAGEIADRLVDIALKTVKAMVILGAPGPIINFASESRRIREADAYAKQLTSMAETAAKSKTRERDAKSFGDAAQAMAEEHEVPTLYIEPDKLAAGLDKAGPGTREKVQAAMPEVYAQIEPATREGELVEIPTGTYLAQIAGTPLQAQLDPHLKHSSTAYSPAEAEEKRAEVKKLVAAADAATADTGTPEQRKAAKKLRDERKEVEARILKQLKAVAEAQPEMRVTPQDMKGQAQVMAALFTALAKTLGVSPLELEALRPVVVLPGAQAPSVEDLQQLPTPNDPNIILKQEAPKHQLYSALLRGVEALPTAAAPASGWRAALKGLVNKGRVKQDEVTWSGIEEWLALQSGKVTREQVVEFLQQNGVRVEEVTLTSGASQDELNKRADELEARVGSLADALSGQSDYEVDTVALVKNKIHVKADVNYYGEDETRTERLQLEVEAEDPTQDGPDSWSLSVYVTFPDRRAMTVPATISGDVVYAGKSVTPLQGEEFTEDEIIAAREAVEQLEATSSTELAQEHQVASDRLDQYLDDAINAFRDGDAERGNDALESANRIEAEYGGDAHPLVDAEGAAGGVKFSDWKVPGGTNYREVLLTLPPGPNAARARTELDAKIAALSARINSTTLASAPPDLASRQPTFEQWLDHEFPTERLREEHGHRRRGDYERWLSHAPDRWLVMELGRLRDEFRQLGEQRSRLKTHRFKSSHWEDTNVLAHLRLTDREDTDGARVLFVEEVQSDWAQKAREGGFAQPPDGLGLGGVKDARPPEAPFVGKTDAWVSLALKRALLLAAEGGYDKLAFANGEQNAEHYDLSKQVDTVYAFASPNGWSIDAVKDGSVIVAEKDVADEALPRLLGKDLAEKILARNGEPEKAVDGTPGHAYRGLDLKVGGEGMRAFYDQIVPNNLKAIAKKIGGRVETVSIPVDPESVVGSSTGLQPVDIATARELHQNGVTLWAGVPAETGTNYTQIAPGNTDSMLRSFGTKQLYRKADESLKQLGVALTDEVRAKLAEGLPLFQGGEQKPLGFFSSKLAAIVLSPNANPSTVLHEMIHWYADTLLRESRGDNAEAKAQAAAMLKLFGVASLEEWDALTPEQRAVHHETLAYSWEQYLAEGKAPSLELESLFQKIAAFMRRVYRQLIEIATNYKQATGQDLPPLSPEMRRFFDMLLASKDAITRAQAVRGQVPLFLNREQARSLGVDDKTWADYEELRRMEADAAAGQLAVDMMRHARWMQNAVLASRKGLQAELDAKRVKLRAQVDTEIRATKVYSAIEVLTRGELDAGDGEKVALKLDRNSVALGRRWLKGNEEKLAPLSTENGTGVSPDFAASLLGFPNGDELMRAIFDAPPLAAAVEQETEKRLQQNELLTDPEEFKSAVDRALQNRIRERVMAAELKMLGGAQRPTRLTLAAVKEAAQQIIARTKVGELDAERGYAAMARASRRAQAAVAEGNVEAALLALRQQMVQTQIARLATEAKREVAAAQVKFRPIFRADKKIAKQRNLATVNIARAVLARWGLGNGEDAQKFLDLARQLEPDTAGRMEAEVARATIDAPVPGKGKLAAPYANATVEQFRAMRDEVLMLWHLAERERTVGVGAERVELDKAVDELLAQLQRTMPTPRGDQQVAQPERDAANFRYFLSSLKQAEHWVARVDGGLDGPMRRLFWRPLREAYDSYLSHRGEALTKLHAAFRDIKGTLSSDKIDASEFVPGLQFNGTLELLGALAHSGNESNLAILLEGYGWEQRNAEGQLDTSRWFDFLDKMMKGGVITQQHVKFVQALWDFNQHELAPVSQRAMRDLFGVFWEPIEATPVPTPWGEMRGGYVPARPDPMHPKNAARNRGAADLTSQLVEGEAGFREAMPGSRAAGHTITRTGATYPVTLDLRVQLQHLDEAMRFAYLQPALRDAARLVTAPRFATELARVDPTALQGVLLPTLQATMRNQLTVPPAKPTGRMIAMLANALRRSTGLGFMFLSVRNALQQLSGLSNASQYVPLRHLRAGVWDALFSPQISTRDAMRKSTFMRLRLDEEIGQLSEDIENVLDPSIGPVKRAVNRYGYVLQRLMQGRTDVAVWHAAFADALERGKADADAVAHADSVVRLSQGSQTPIDVADYQRAGALGRLLTQFTGYFNTVLNQIASQQGAGARTVAVARALLVPTLIATAIAALLAPSKDFEDKDGDGDVWDEWFEYFAKAEASGALAMLPVLGPAVASQFLTGDYRPGGDRITPAPFWVVVQAAGRLATLEGDGRVSGREIRDAATVLSALTGVPVTPLGRLAGFLADVESGRAKAQGPGDFIRGVLNGR